MKKLPTVISEVRFAFVEAGWHAEIVAQARSGFFAEIGSAEGDRAEVSLFKVPGAYDIPLLAMKLAETGEFDAIVAAGFVVDGGIYRHEFVASTVIDALMRVQLDTGVPVISSVLTPHQFQENRHQIEFFKSHFDVKGREAARAALQIVANLQALHSHRETGIQMAAG